MEFSTSAKAMRSSEIRRLMSLAADPAIISFAGGMPANSLFPTDIVDELYAGLSLQAKQTALQYGPTSGYPPLLNSLREYLSAKGLPTEGQGLIITTGAQQAINLLTKVLIDQGDTVITEQPSFIGALAAFKSYGANLVGVSIDEHGIDIDELRKVLDSETKAKILYLNPFFQNPSGIMYSPERKAELLEVLRGRDICLLEDDPYGELYFNEEDREQTIPLKAMGNEPVPICYTGSFAKIFGPGLRLGWLLGPTEILEKCELAKQSMDACSATFSQVLANEYLKKNKLPGYLAFLRKTYARRAESMLNALGKYMPPGVTWTKPRGGFYIWVTLPESIDSTAVFDDSLKGGAAFVIGSAFDPYGIKNNCFRLAFSHTPEEKIETGIRTIAEAVKIHM